MRSLLVSVLLLLAVIGIYQSTLSSNGIRASDLQDRGDEWAEEVSRMDPSVALP